MSELDKYESDSKRNLELAITGLTVIIGGIIKGISILNKRGTYTAYKKAASEENLKKMNNSFFVSSKRKQEAQDEYDKYH